MRIATFAAFAALIATATQAVARTWTSRDGSRSFEAEYVGSHDAGRIVVRYPGGSEGRFALDALSQADREFVAANSSPTSPSGLVAAEIAGNLVRLDGDKLVPFRPKAKPAHYFVYFTSFY